METVANEAILNLYKDIGIDPSHQSPALNAMGEAGSRYIKDLKLNVSAVLGSANMNKKETSLLALAVAVNEKHSVLMNAFNAMARNEGAGDAEIAEAHACAAVMSTNNVFYRFRHYMDGVSYYNNHPAGLRMSVMMNPAMGKELFELMSLVLSAVNGCERCVTSHEASVKQHGATEPRIYDAIRLGAVIRTLCVMV
ncbi:MAG: carboxymuconolactone decarboxylase family protein [Bacteroidetes bacterium]|nr:carboxymuconolactone decarboxylase family protein [Bacteroidota bacterium]